MACHIGIGRREWRWPHTLILKFYGSPKGYMIDMIIHAAIVGEVGLSGLINDIIDDALESWITMVMAYSAVGPVLWNPPFHPAKSDITNS